MAGHHPAALQPHGFGHTAKDSHPAALDLESRSCTSTRDVNGGRRLATRRHRCGNSPMEGTASRATRVNETDGRTCTGIMGVRAVLPAWTTSCDDRTRTGICGTRALSYLLGRRLFSRRSRWNRTITRAGMGRGSAQHRLRAMCATERA
jgi:hypothetical protein